MVTCVAGTLGGLLTWPGRGGDQSEAAGEAGHSREQREQPPVTGKQKMAGSQQPAIVRRGHWPGDSRVTAAIILDTIHPHPHTHGSSNKSPATCGISSEIMMNALSMPDINYMDFKMGFSQFTIITSSVNECDAFSILCRYPPSDNSLAELWTMSTMFPDIWPRRKLFLSQWAWTPEQC